MRTVTVAGDSATKPRALSMSMSELASPTPNRAAQMAAHTAMLLEEMKAEDPEGMCATLPPNTPIGRTVPSATQALRLLTTVLTICTPRATLVTRWMRRRPARTTSRSASPTVIEPCACSDSAGREERPQPVSRTDIQRAKSSRSKYATSSAARRLPPIESDSIYGNRRIYGFDVRGNPR